MWRLPIKTIVFRSYVNSLKCNCFLMANSERLWKNFIHILPSVQIFENIFYIHWIPATFQPSETMKKGHSAAFFQFRKINLTKEMLHIHGLTWWTQLNRLKKPTEQNQNNPPWLHDLLCHLFFFVVALSKMFPEFFFLILIPLTSLSWQEVAELTT